MILIFNRLHYGIVIARATNLWLRENTPSPIYDARANAAGMADAHETRYAPDQVHVCTCVETFASHWISLNRHELPRARAVSVCDV